MNDIIFYHRERGGKKIKKIKGIIPVIPGWMIPFDKSRNGWKDLTRGYFKIGKVWNLDID